MNSVYTWIKKFDWSFISIIKLAVVVVVVTVAFAIVLGVLGMLTRGLGLSSYSLQSMFNTPTMGIGGGMMMDEFAVSSRVATDKMMYMPEPAYGGGDNPEEYEHRSHSVYFETRRFDHVCAAIRDLKGYEYVLFDSENTSDTWCNYSFRVDTDHEADVLATITSLNPKDVSVSAYSVEQSVEGNAQEIAMLKERLASQKATLTQAEAAFSSLIAQATRSGDTATLSEVINNKINTIDRLTQQILTYEERLARLEKSQGNMEREVAYAQFDVSVQKLTFIDGKELGAAWKNKLQEVVRGVNNALIALTLGLVTFALSALQFVVLLVVSILGLTVVARILYGTTRRIWNYGR